ncbi:MAG: Hsp70 family protein [Clostridia bacterium]|nr:Hsp70 family protein [Clostridia bacterium]
MSSLLIGIDLGTSTTEAAIYRNGRPEMILNLDGTPVTPSAVGIDRDGNWVAGSRAKAQYLLEPERTAIEVKRLTGSGKRLTLGKADYSPVELQEKLLSYVRQYACAFLGENVDRAVISVPAYFDHSQRMETILAGEMAGFTVERIISEPTAAAMSYGLEHLDEESHVLVYDLGGGTFDVTLLEMFGGVLEVKASSGDNRLGGKDFDELLMNELYRRFRKNHHADLRNDRQAAARIKEAAEQCKIDLSRQESARVLLPALFVRDGKPVDMDEIVTREDFERLALALVERTHAPMEQVLQDTGLLREEIDHILLVGGSTRMPMIARDVTAFFGKAPLSAVHPEYAVAMGASILAGIISGEIDPEEGLIMTDVSAFSLGIRAENRTGDFHYMSVIIPRNTTIPVSRTEVYETSSDNQTEAKIEVYQGESPSVRDNHFLGEFTVKGIPKGKKGKELIDVTFAYDLNALLKVKAVIRSTGKEADTEISLKEAGESLDLSKWKEAPGAKECRTVIRRAERILNQAGADPGSLETEIGLALDRLKEALIRENEEKIKEYRKLLEQMVAYQNSQQPG